VNAASPMDDLINVVPTLADGRAAQPPSDGANGKRRGRRGGGSCLRHRHFRGSPAATEDDRWLSLAAP